MNDTPLPNSTIRPARDRQQAFVAARAGRTGINVDTLTKSHNNYTNGLCHRDDLARLARGVREPPRDFRRAPRL